MSMEISAAPASSTPRLYLVTPRVDEPVQVLSDLEQMLDIADIAAVLLQLADADERTLINRTKAIAPVVQRREVALLLAGHANLVARAGADGAHLTGIDAFNAAVASLKPGRIAGCGGLRTRHDAMLAGEAGADYVMFGEPDQHGHRPAFESVEERVAWWAELFEMPSVGYANRQDEIGPLVAAGADFIAVGDCIWNDARGPGAAVADAARRLVMGEAVA
jgi:thiamine-phosphate pyrophosphorylase